ncbi:MAG: hypothetical protein LBK99_05370, partial [Opitutaceae bacterium]|nr:hypothetical protein [Opitutaceae bacterium]
MNNDTANHIAADAAATRATAGADEREARVLAVVLGEAPPAEIEAVEKLLAADPALRAWRDELVAATLPLLRDTLCATAARPADVTVPSLRLDDARREKLLVLLTQGIRGGICGAGVPPASGVARASSPCALPHRVARASSPWTALRAARLLRALVFRIPGKDAHARTRASGGKTPRHIADQSPVPWLALIRENRLLFTTCAALLFGIIGAAIAGVFTIRMRPGPVRPATAYLELVPSGRTADQSGSTEDRLVSHAVSPAPAALAAAWGGGGGGPARETNAFAAAAPATISLPKPSPGSRPVA